MIDKSATIPKQIEYIRESKVNKSAKKQSLKKMKRYGKEPDKKPKHDIKTIQSQIHTRESMEETKQDYSTNN